MELLRSECELVRLNPPGERPDYSEERIVAAARDCDALVIRANGRVTRRILRECPELLVVGRHGVGVEHIDVDAAAELGVWVVNTPRANVGAVAEHALGMMLALAKRFPEADRACRSGDFSARYRLKGVELKGRTLGLVGWGRIGRRLGELAGAIGMKVIHSDPASPESVPRDDLLRRSDVVALHVPLTPSTRRLIDGGRLSLLKPGAILLNTSRGGVLDEGALIDALRNGRLAGAGLDVFEKEPLPDDSELARLPNVILTPHVAAHTREALRKMSLVAKDVLRVLRGEEPANAVVRPDAPRRPA